MGIDPGVSENLLLLLWNQNCWVTFINENSEVSEWLKLVPEVVQLTHAI